VAKEISGYAWEKAGRIWYITLRDKLQPRSSFRDAARLSFQVAGELFEAGSLEQQAIRKGWAEVGISIEEEGEEEKGCLEALIAIFSSGVRPSS
jgi:Zn-dependent metalloprotease